MRKKKKKLFDEEKKKKKEIKKIYIKYIKIATSFHKQDQDLFFSHPGWKEESIERRSRISLPLSRGQKPEFPLLGHAWWKII